MDASHVALLFFFVFFLYRFYFCISPPYQQRGGGGVSLSDFRFLLFFPSSVEHDRNWPLPEV